MEVHIFLGLLLMVCVTMVTPVCIPNQNCSPPSCRCREDTSRPGGIPPADTPQMVAFTFDDAITPYYNGFYNHYFPETQLNPNGCPTTMTLFVSDQYTQYAEGKKLYDRGIEMASHSVTHQTPTTWWKQATEQQLIGEIVAQRDNIVKKAGIPSNKVVGWRSPFLQPSGERQFSVLANHNFRYDSTLTVSRAELPPTGQWPFTLDFGWTFSCMTAPCPLDSYPGLWSIPIIPMTNPSPGVPAQCAYVDSCVFTTKQAAFDFLWENFLHYNGTRTPMFISMHASWFAYPVQKAAMDDFINRLVSLDDVYLVTVSQVLDWMQNPKPLGELWSLPSWQCGASAVTTPKVTAQPTTQAKTMKTLTTEKTSTPTQEGQPSTEPSVTPTTARGTTQNQSATETTSAMPSNTTEQIETTTVVEENTTRLCFTFNSTRTGELVTYCDASMRTITQTCIISSILITILNIF